MDLQRRWKQEGWSTQVSHFLDLRALNRSFFDLAGYYGAYRAGDRQLTGTGEPERLTSVPVTQNFFALLGVQPMIGRSFTAEECQEKTIRSTGRASELRTSGRGGLPRTRSMVGRKLILNNRPATVVGVLPASFDFASVFAPGHPSISLFPGR